LYYYPVDLSITGSIKCDSSSCMTMISGKKWWLNGWLTGTIWEHVPSMLYNIYVGLLYLMLSFLAPFLYIMRLLESLDISHIWCCIIVIIFVILSLVHFSSIWRQVLYVWLISSMHIQDKTVSVFETTIRILGGLLSAHLIASDYATVYYSLQLQYYVELDIL